MTVLQWQHGIVSNIVTSWNLNKFNSRGKALDLSISENKAMCRLEYRQGPDSVNSKVERMVLNQE